jgi:hypothetical protein
MASLEILLCRVFGATPIDIRKVCTVLLCRSHMSNFSLRKVRLPITRVHAALESFNLP